MWASTSASQACGNSSQRALGGIVAQADPTVIEKAREGVDALEHVIHRLGDVAVTRELSALLSHPFDEIVDLRGDVGAACSKALRRRQSFDRAFQHEYGVDLLHGLECDWRDHSRCLAACLRGDISKLEELAS